MAPNPIFPEFDSKNFLRLELIGKGEFGFVYKAYDYKRKSFVALKFVEVKPYTQREESVVVKEESKLSVSEPERTPNIFNYFEEGKILRKVNEINGNDFILCYDAFQDFKGENNKKIIFSMELGAAALSDIIYFRKKYCEEELLYIISNILNQLMLAQNHHICHGDIKLADIVLFLNDNKIIYKLVDFGFGHILPNDILDSKEVKGFSYLYSSPELRRTVSEQSFLIDPYKSDIYAIGVVILKMMGVDNDKIELIQKNGGILDKEFKKKYQKYPNCCNLVENLLNDKAENRFSYQDLLQLLSNLEIKVPNDNLYITNTKEKHTASMDEIDIEKYVNFFQEEIKDLKVSRQYCYVAYKLLKGKNHRREAFWREKCGDFEKELLNYEDADKSYLEAMSLILKYNDDIEDMKWVVILQNKRMEIKKLRSDISN